MLFRIVDWYNHTDCKNLICDLDPKYFNIQWIKFKSGQGDEAEDSTDSTAR